MSVATEFAPVVYIPPQARPQEQPTASATILELRRPADRSVAAPLRLTRRGVVVLAAAVGVLAAGLLGLARLSAPSAAPAQTPAAATVTVRDGDTLWSLAAQVAPTRDPRAEVAQLQRLNHLDGVAIVAGQVLRTR